MKLRYVTAALLGAGLCLPVAVAGTTQPAPVIIDLDGQFAHGDIITARDAKSDDVLLGCGTRHYDFGGGGTFETGFCQARVDGGDTVTCFTQSPFLLDRMKNLNDTSYIRFSWDDDGTGNLTCNYVGFSTQSFYQDKHTMGNQTGKDR
ncbi:MAG: hypothetical protein GYB42_10230 [Alphaproteobacteria bacterium]|nr:hypothetical protein [Alphaproteobacteria bacterium]